MQSTTNTWRVGDPMPTPSLLQWGDTHGWHPSTGNQLLQILRHPTPTEVEAHRSGRIEVALLDRAPLLVLLARYGPRQPWQESPWTWIPSAPFPSWGSDDEGHLLFTAALVDGADGVVRSLRIATATRAFSRRLTRAVQAVQLAGPISEQEFMGLVGQHQRNYPRLERAVAHAQARCRLGA